MFCLTDGSITVASKTAEIHNHSKQQAVIEFFVVEEKKVTCIHEHLLNVW
jgi:hypothetical protein